MTEIDFEALAQVNAWAAKRLEWQDRRGRLAPVFEAMAARIRNLTTTIVPDMLAGPTANSRKSIVTLEASIAAFPAKLSEIEQEFELVMASARRRTAALRLWLGELS